MDLSTFYEPNFYRNLLIDPSPGLSQLDKICDIVFNQKIENMPKLLPGYGTATAVSEIFDETEELTEEI
jgi:hypothetical protein